MTWIFRNLIIVSRGQRPLTPTESAVHSPLGSGVCQRFKGGSIFNVARGLPLHRQVNGEMNGNQQINRPTGDSLQKLTSCVD